MSGTHCVRCDALLAEDETCTWCWLYQGPPPCEWCGGWGTHKETCKVKVQEKKEEVA